MNERRNDIITKIETYTTQNILSYRTLTVHRYRHPWIGKLILILFFLSAVETSRLIISYRGWGKLIDEVSCGGRAGADGACRAERDVT